MAHLPPPVCYAISISTNKGAANSCAFSFFHPKGPKQNEAIPNKSLRFYPSNHCKRARWETYREAWHLLEPTQYPCGAGALAREPSQRGTPLT
jgi:hypothetical protein